IVAAGGALYMVLFLYRHQTIVPPGSRYKLSTQVQIIFFVLITPLYVSVGPAVYITRIRAIDVDHFKKVVDFNISFSYFSTLLEYE
ncbi:hypothetical protein PMAYCL1PPCAC_05963, partial [Pristionchus mayeri]